MKSTDVGGDILHRGLHKCGKHGFNQNQPKLWCRSRFLSRLDCVKERRERLPAYVDHFKTVEPARRKKNEKPSRKNSFQKANDSARIDWIKNIFREDLARVAVDLDLSVECLDPSHTLPKVFQSQAPMIHTLKLDKGDPGNFISIGFFH